MEVESKYLAVGFDGVEDVKLFIPELRELVFKTLGDLYSFLLRYSLFRFDLS